MSRKVKDLPQHFKRAKIEYDRLMNLFWSNRLNDKGKRDESLENVALLYAICQEFMKYSENHFHSVGNSLLEIMNENETNKVVLAEYGKKVFFDEEASWLYIEDLSESEWKEYDMNCNKQFLEKKKESK